ncbi:MAG: hypothetical protein LBC29_05100 [Propionibacteriaceae bacterium]|jgi:hypothetical protein|nr:hypothetical protein [Propionibacteriaceae bacterium]
MTQASGSQQYWQAPKTASQPLNQPTQPVVPIMGPPNPPLHPRAMAYDPELRQEAQAALGAYRELGQINPEYEDAVVASFLARIDQQLGQRAVAAAEPIPQAAYGHYVQTTKGRKTRTVYTAAPPPKSNSFGQILALVATILGLAIPLTAIAAEVIGVIGFIIVWIGITAVGVSAFRALTSNKPDDAHKALGQ